MTVVLESDHIYLIVILLLMLIQAYQFKRLFDLRKECDRIWEQIGSFALALSQKIIEMERDLDLKQYKDENTRNSKTTD